jgi:hypothetical protein
MQEDATERIEYIRFTPPGNTTKIRPRPRKSPKGNKMKNYDLDLLSEIIHSSVLARFPLPHDEEHLTVREVREICEKFRISLMCIPANKNPEQLMKLRVVREIKDVVFERFISNILPKVAANGDLECAWDDEKNEAVFWMEKEPSTQIGKLLAGTLFPTAQPTKTKPKRSIWTRSKKEKLVSKIAEMFPYRKKDDPDLYTPMTTPAPETPEFKEFARRNGIEVVFADGMIWKLADGTPAVNCKTHVITQNPWGPLCNTGLRIPREVARNILTGS